MQFHTHRLWLRQGFALDGLHSRGSSLTPAAGAMSTQVMEQCCSIRTIILRKEVKIMRTKSKNRRRGNEPILANTISQPKNSACKSPSNEKIKDDGGWICICGNIPHGSGFYPCDQKGIEVEPTPEEWTTDCYVCYRCGRIINQHTLHVVGRKV